MGVIIGVGSYKASHTAVAIDPTEALLGQVNVRVADDQVERLLAWAALTWPATSPFPQVEAAEPIKFVDAYADSSMARCRCPRPGRWNVRWSCCAIVAAHRYCEWSGPSPVAAGFAADW